MTANTETRIERDPTVPLIRTTREFNAPPAKVFRAHTDPDLFVQWNGPAEANMRIDHHDCRTGGSYRYTVTVGGFEAAFRGSFHEIRPNELIVQTFTFEPMPDGVALERITFEPLPGNRCRLVSTSLVDSFETRDAIIASGMEPGVIEGYQRLDHLLTT
jgi:uncharacterized protein YndB with AHSA1/START domain